MRLLRILPWLTAVLAAPALAAEWRPVPGAAELEVDLASAQQHRALVTAWVRHVGQSRLPAMLQAPEKPARNAYRTALLIQFDCDKRTLRTLALNAYNSSGAPVFMSSVPGPLLPLPGDMDLGWTYDAVCEWGRGRG